MGLFLAKNSGCTDETPSFAGEPAGLPVDQCLGQPSLELAPTTIGADEADAEPGLNLDQSSGMASRLGLSLRETPASVAVASRQDLERSGARTFQEAANALPGVNASAPPGFGGFVSYRGFTSSQITQMFNGINVATGLARPVDAWIYDRVELVGGPSSLINGAGSVGGSLNYVTKLADRREQAAEGLLGYGSYDTTQTAFGVNHALSPAGAEVQHYARLDVSHNTSNGYIDRQERDAWSLAFSLLSDLTRTCPTPWRWNTRMNTRTAPTGAPRCSIPRPVS
ncbi:hypothetical protein PBOI14_33310 [Pseudomonas sp. Boi14]|nr:hypothetical protein PBOI14_33310 [Pseudomonas sp. Boi14]